MDGSQPGGLPVELEDLSQPVVLTSVEVVSGAAERSGSAAATCIRAHGGASLRTARAVERIGVTSTTVTFATASGLHGCDDSPGPREGERRWCGTSFGLLTAKKLEDPRLDLAGCRTSSGEPMGFAWVEPASETRYVAVEQDGYAEVHEPAGELPIRIATATDVRVEGSRASFKLSEYDASGELLRSYVLDAAAAG